MPPAANVDLTAALAWAEQMLGELANVTELSGGWTSTMLALETHGGDEAVLRLMTREPWRSHGPTLTSRERDIQRLLAPTAVPAPLSLALDAHGSECGVSAHLMSRLPGRLEVERSDQMSLEALAQVLAAIHDVTPAAPIRPYQSWAWEEKYVVPAWASDADAWRASFDLLRTPGPDFEPCLIHRDYHPRNVLWHDAEISGVVDWVETSIGPAWLDVAHCATNVALLHGNEAAERFASAYVETTGRVRQPFFDVMDVVGFLPPPGKEGFVQGAAERRRLEERLVFALARC